MHYSCRFGEFSYLISGPSIISRYQKIICTGSIGTPFLSVMKKRRSGISGTAARLTLRKLPAGTTTCGAADSLGQLLVVLRAGHKACEDFRKAYNMRRGDLGPWRG
uniref:(northern house mosquito) hypothetical protein n=1 Tax=Culex pipiens TaxID=7175 RepID=A0A8D8F009_CULPI